MVSFLDKVIKDIINKYKNFNNLVLILPNLSSKEKINNIIKNKFNVNDFCIPKIYLFKDLMIKISNLKIVENFTLWIKIYNIFYKKKSFKNFIKSYSKIINYFNILDLNLVDISIFFSLIKSIENTEFFLNKKKKIFFTWKEISKYYFDIKKFLLKNKIGYIGLVYKTAVSYLNKFLHKNYNIKKFIFIGINYLNISEKEIINKLIKYKKAEIYYDLDNYYYNDFKQEANLFIKEHHKNWKKIEGKSFKWIENNFIKKKNIQIIGTSCMITQIKIIGELLYNIFSKKKNIGIIIKDEKIINPIINSIPNNIKEFNITSNYLIENINLSNTFSKIFKLFSKKKFFKKKKFLYSNVYEFFFDGYIKSIFNLEIKECNFLHFLLKKKKSYISYNEIKNKLLNKNLLSILDIENKNNKIYINIIINFCKKIQIFFLKKKKKFFLELKFLFFFKKWLNTLKKYHFFYKKENIYFLYKKWISVEKLTFISNFSKKLQIINFFESRLIDFDTVIIPFMNEGFYPDNKNIFYKIPFFLKKKFNIPIQKYIDADYAYHFYRLLQRSKNIYLLYNTEPDSIFTGEKSRFISQLEIESPHKIKYKIISPTFKIQKKKNIKINKNSNIIKNMNNFLLKGISFSFINLYILNPLEFYYTKILKIKNNNFEKKFFLGKIIHKTLKKLYYPMINFFLKKKNINNMIDKYQIILKKIFIKKYNLDYKKGKNYFIFNIAKNYIKNIIYLDKKSIIHNKILIKHIEYNTFAMIKIPFIKKKIKIYGKIDRIDEYNGIIRIIDYKSNNFFYKNINFSLKDFDKIINEKKYSKIMQLLIYSYILLYNNKNINNFYIGILLSNSKYISLNFNKKKIINKKIIYKFISCLSKKIFEIFNVNISFKEKKNEIYYK